MELFIILFVMILWGKGKAQEFQVVMFSQLDPFKNKSKNLVMVLQLSCQSTFLLLVVSAGLACGSGLTWGKLGFEWLVFAEGTPALPVCSFIHLLLVPDLLLGSGFTLLQICRKLQEL